MWTDNPVFGALNFAFAPEDVHYFHYRFLAENVPGDHGACTFTVQAFGDLDDDSVFSTYERSGELGLIEGVGLGVLSLSELTIIDGEE